MRERESPIMRLAWLAMVKAGAKIWRNNVGIGLQGEQHTIRNASPSSGLRVGDVVIRSPRWIRFGLCEGSSDLIGYLPTKITPEMVGTTVAVFVAAEAKAMGGNTNKNQRAYIDAVRADGGIAFTFRSEAEALQNLRVP